MRMQRRRFLELLGTAMVGSKIAYSFPSIIVPKNIIIPSTWYDVDSNIITWEKLTESWNRISKMHLEPTYKVSFLNWELVQSEFVPKNEIWMAEGKGLINRITNINVPSSNNI